MFDRAIGDAECFIPKKPLALERPGDQNSSGVRTE